MSYNYSVPQNYYPQDAAVYNTVQSDKKSSSPLATLGFIAGGTFGGIKAFEKVPYFDKNGDIKDSFAKGVHKKYIKTAASSTEKALDEQLLNVIKEIDKTQSPDELRALLNKNPKVKNKLSKGLVKNVTENNLVSNKATIKNSVLAKYTENLQTTKNKIFKSWDANSASFVEKRSIGDKTYKIIKNNAIKIKTGFVAKAALISGAATALVISLLQKAVNKKKSQKV